MFDNQDQYDDAMLDFSMGDYDSAIEKFHAILKDDVGNFDAQLSLGMAFYRKGDYESAIREGHKAEKLQPQEQLVHTNLSLFYMKSGDKKTAEHHGLQARISSWRGNMDAPADDSTEDPELKIATQSPPPPPTEFPDMPWKKNKKIDGGDATSK